MKEDYLWNKTGDDPEIEKLENALQVFCYKETAPPSIPLKVLPFTEAVPPRRRFPFAFAFAAFAVLAVIFLGTWMQISRDQNEVATHSVEPITPQTIMTVSNDLISKKVEISADSMVNDRKIKRQLATPKITKVTTVVSLSARQNRKNAENLKVKEPTVRLTIEEKYAYDQLMLAITITSSKLKLVKDKIEGIEEKNAVLKDGQ